MPQDLPRSSSIDSCKVEPWSPGIPFTIIPANCKVDLIILSGYCKQSQSAGKLLVPGSQNRYLKVET